MTRIKNFLAFIYTPGSIACKVGYAAIPGNLIPALMQDYTPTIKAVHDNLDRVCERFDLRKKAYHFTV